MMEIKKIRQKKCHKKRKFQDCKNCLEAAQINSKINHLEKNEN